jgi:hypothetical protein
MKSVLIPILFLLSAGNYVLAQETVKGEVSNNVSDFIYSDPVGERYLTLTILKDGKEVRSLHAELESGGAFEREILPRLSPHGTYIYIVQVESADLETPHGPVMSQTAYCSLVSVSNGCVLIRETGEFCGGAFTLNEQWASSLYPELNLAGAAPRVGAFASGELKPDNSHENSFENLIACDPPSTKNADGYRAVIKNNIFDLDGTQLESLQRNLE